MPSSVPIGSNRLKGQLRAHGNPPMLGVAARTVIPVLPQEDPAALEARIERYIQDIQPRNAAEEISFPRRHGCHG